jgi:hypothetical protein
MSTPEELSNDSLGDLLRMNSGAESSRDALREAVYKQTVGTLRFRRRMKKVVLATSLAVCYLAGMATMGLSPAPQPNRPVVSPSSMASNAEKAQKPQTKPLQLTREEQLRREGDRLLEKGDMKKAIRRYELALNVASEDQRAISPERDTWLLMALKSARSQETKHERSNP